MAEYPHDPEFPYLVIIDFSEERLARFLNKEDAIYAMKYLWHGTNVRLIDTTPKPRIPVDAQYLVWSDGAFLPQIAQKNPIGVDSWWHGDGHDARWYSEEDLLRKIGDAEIIVLDSRKEES